MPRKFQHTQNDDIMTSTMQLPSARMHTHSGNTALLFSAAVAAIFLLFLPAAVLPAPVGHISVPFDARPGHVISHLPWKSGQDRPKVIEPELLSRHFTVMNRGVLVTSQKITELAGWKITLKIEHNDPETSLKWLEEVPLYIEHGSEARASFDDQPYTGYILENEAVGMEVQGLENVKNAIEKFPYGCIVSIESGDREYFQVKHTTGGASFKLLSKAVFDRELHPTYFILLAAKCPDGKNPSAYVKIDVADVNDNKPHFEKADYFVSLLSTPKASEPIVKVKAVDPDYGNQVMYRLQGINTGLFRIDQQFGSITIPYPEELGAKTYELEVVATDQGGLTSTPARVRIEVAAAYDNKDFYPSGNSIFRALRKRRAVRTEMKFVIDNNWTGGLFFVSDTENPVEEENYRMDVDGLMVDLESGLVSRDGDLPDNETMEFSVNVTRTDDPSYVDYQPVFVTIVQRVYTEPLLTNEFVPLAETVPVWIRPYTTIIKLEAIDRIEDGVGNCPVRYQLQSGGDGRFTVDTLTGEVQVAGRAPFEPDGLEYTLAVSTMCLGSELRTQTPAQTLTVQVGARPPQFLRAPYDVWYSEYSTQGEEITYVRAKSFQDLSLRYTWTLADPLATDPGVLELNSETGGVTLLQAQVFVDPASVHQLRYNVTVTEQYSDLATTAMVTFNLQPENRNAPILPPAFYIQRDVLETVSLTTDILTVTYKDVDWLENGTVTFTTSIDEFIVVPSPVDGPDGKKEGILRPATRLDYDFLEGHYYEFEITATDNAPEGLQKSASTMARVFMLNANDEAPVLEPVDQKVYLKEGTAEDELVHVIQAYDPDGDGLTFAFTDCDGGGTATQCNIFTLNANTGHITLNEQVPADTQNILLNFEVTDDGTCCTSGDIHTVKGTVSVEFIGVNHPPEFPDCESYAPVLLEHSPMETGIINITAIDTDVGSNGELTYSVVIDNRPYFSVRSRADMEGTELYSLVEFDREGPLAGFSKVDGDIKYKVTVTATDSGQPALQTNCFFFVTIGDINDQAPQFDDPNNQVTIRNNLASGARVIRVFAVDEDKLDTPNSQVRYSISTQPDGCPDCFTMEENTGWIKLNTAQLPGDSTATMNVRAEDLGNPSQSRETSCSISWLPPTDSRLPPVWDDIGGEELDDIINLAMDENLPRGTVLPASLSATLLSGSPPLYFLIRGNTPQENSGRNFRMSSVPGDVDMEIVIENPLDYESVNEFWLHLRASNPTSGRYTDVRLNTKVNDLNDNFPTFEGLNENGQYPAAVTEDRTAEDSFVFNVVGIDLDGTSPNNLVKYYFPSTCVDCKAFKLDNNTGYINAAQSFDRAEQERYRLTVSAYDGAPGINPPQPNQVSISVQIEVIGSSQFPPYFVEAGETISMVEAQPLNSTIAVIVANDPDPTFNYPQYEIIGGDEKRMFGYDKSSGRIYNTGFLIYDEQPVYYLRYRVFDGFEQDVYWVNISLSKTNYLPPVFESLVYEVTLIEEHAPISQPVNLTKVKATDPDNRGDINYHLAGAWSENFQISIDGSVSVTTSLDRDYPFGVDPWQINVEATDENNFPGGNPKSGYGIFNYYLTDINDNAPFFDTSTLVGSVDEGASAPTEVMTVLAYDYDNGANQTVSYAAVVVPVDGSNQEMFEISSNGVVTRLVVLNREERDLFYMKVRASDGGNPPMSTEEWLTIHVTDINDNAPFFPEDSYEITIPENQARGTSVLALSAQDNDIGDNAKLTYTITGGDGDNFYMDSIFVAGTGVIKIKTVLDYDAKPVVDEFSFTVQVTDGPTSDTASVIVRITDTNDNAPVFSPSMVGRNLSEDTAVGTAVTTFTATDIDEGVNAQFEYLIDYENTDPLKNFAIDAVSGEVTIRNKLDREVVAVHNVNILAVDKGEPPMTGTALLTVTVNDINDNPPRLVEDYLGYVYLDTQEGDLVLTLTATDPDTPQNGPPFTFTLDCNRPECTDFTVANGQVGTEGVIRANRNGYNREDLDRTYYDLDINISDSGSPTLSATYTVRVVIESRNDNNHFAGNKRVKVNNYKGEYDNIPLGRVYCEDLDDWDIPDKTFEFQGENPDGFLLDEDTGNVTMLKAAGRGIHALSFNVYDRVRDVSAICTMDVLAVYITDDMLENAASFRITDMTAQEFITEDAAGDSPYEKFVRELSAKLGNKELDNDVFSVNDVENATREVDIIFSSHGSPAYPAARLNGIILTNQADFESVIGSSISEVPVNPCSRLQCWDAGCSEYLDVTDAPLYAGTNTTSLVSVDATWRARCECDDYPDEGDRVPDTCKDTSCLNGGACVQGWNGISCVCPDGFDGPRCQQTRHSFTGNGWAWFRSLSTCAVGKLRVEFATEESSGLILYAGPMVNPPDGEFPDYFVLELQGGYPRIRVNLGDGEVVLRLDASNGADVLNDGKWHTIEYIYEKQELRMIVDHCAAADIDENINATSADRSKCEAQGTSPGEYFTLNVYSPLEMGGRSNPSVSYPSGVMGGFNGCVRNLMQNGILYDLHIGETGEKSAEGSADGCDRDGCALDPLDPAANPCPQNSTCVGSDITGGNVKCVCDPGWTGDNCDEEASSKTFTGAESFIEWQLKDSAWNNTKAFELQVMFRTRDENGIVFSARSFSTLERFALRVHDTQLQFVYDLGDDDNTVSLPYVNVSDGVWHVAHVYRYGNQVVLRLDGGEGKYYNESFPNDARFRLMSVSQDDVFGGAIVSFNDYNDAATVSDPLVNSCISDVRLEQLVFPLDTGEDAQSPIARVLKSVDVEDQCLSDACTGVTCPAGMSCVDRWKMPYCKCLEDDETEVGDVCVLITDCSIPRCVNGFCIVVDGQWRCDCEPSWFGEACDTQEPIIGSQVASISNGAIAAIVVSLVLLLLLMIIVMLMFRNKKPDYLLGVEAEDDVRDNVIYYDEEGAGEEDMHAYDLSRLQKPVGPGDEPGVVPRTVMPNTMSSAPHEPRREWDEMPHMAPEPMSAPRRPLWKPGDAPPEDIGDFVSDRLNDADNDPNAPPYDSVREYEYEGAGSTAGSLSSLNSSGSGDLDFDYLNDLGPPFRKLADMYGAGDDDGESSV